MAAEGPSRRPAKALLADRGWPYDIFLLHAGENKAFAEKLDGALCAKSVLPFLDSKSLRLGDEVMEDALVRSSRFIVAIMSHELKDKPLPADELKKALERHRQSGRIIVPVFLSIKAGMCSNSTNDLVRKVSRIAGIEKKDSEDERDFIDRTVFMLENLVQQTLSEESDVIPVVSGRQQSLASDVVEDSKRTKPAHPRHAVDGHDNRGSPPRGGVSGGQPMPESMQRDAFYPLSAEDRQQLEQEQHGHVDAVVRHYSQKAVKEHLSANRKRIEAIERKTDEMRQNDFQSQSSFCRSSHMPTSSSPELGNGGGQPHETSQSFSASGANYVVQGRSNVVNVHHHYYSGGPKHET